MSNVRTSLASVAVVLVGLAAQGVMAGDCCHCGNDCGVRKVCRLVPDKKTIEKTVYGCECADICIPGKSCRGGLNCKEKCGEGNDCDGCSHKPYALLKWFDWEPGCAQIKTVKKLTKFTVTKEVCSWKWKVEDVCDGCCLSSDCVAGMDGTPVEKAPASASADEVPAPPVPISPAAYLRSAAKK